MGDEYRDNYVLKALLGRTRPVPGPGEIVCPDCDGLGTGLSMTGNGIPCRMCTSTGLAKVCRHCAKPMLRQSSYCGCPGDAHQCAEDEVARALRVWEAAGPHPFDQWSGDGLWSETLNKWFHDAGALDEYIDEADVEDPLCLYDAKPVSWRLQAEDVAHRLEEEQGWEGDMTIGECVGSGAWGTLQALLDTWCESHVDGCGWKPDYSKALQSPARDV